MTTSKFRLEEKVAADMGAQRILEAIDEHRRFLVTGHIDPDPDALGSVLAMVRLLRQLGKEAIAASPDPVPPGYRFLPGSAGVLTPGSITGPFDALVVLDCAPDRIGDLAEWRHRVKAVINIDHHETNPRREPIHWVDPAAAALGEMIYRLCRQAGAAIDADMATCLYTAIMTDTGSFRYSNTTADTLAIAADLVSKGADPAAIAEQIYDQRPWSYVQALALSLNTLQRSEDGSIAWMVLTQDMIARAGGRPDDTDGFIQFPRMIAGVEVALLFKELESGDTKVSLRSRGRMDVSLLASQLGGGGHPKAAGVLLRQPLSEAIPLVLERTRALLEAVRD